MQVVEQAVLSSTVEWLRKEVAGRNMPIRIANLGLVCKDADAPLSLPVAVGGSVAVSDKVAMLLALEEAWNAQKAPWFTGRLAHSGRQCN